MKKCCLFVVSLLSALIFLSCSLGLDPAKSGSTEVSFSVGEATAGRLIAPGTGYLYIRTVGGPTGDNGPFYGPYQLSSGSVFTTTDIPAGSYDGFGILYATEPLEGLNTSNLNLNIDTTFTQLMSMPDDAFIAFAMEDFPTQFPNLTAFDILIDGRATGEMLENVRIVAGQRNVIAARLLPIIGENLFTGLDEYNSFNDFSIFGNEPMRIRRYFEIQNLPSGVWFSFDFNYTVNGDTVFMGSIFIYDQNGILLGEDIANSSGYGHYTGTFSVPFSGGNSVYGYVDFIGDTLELSGSFY